MELPPVLSKNHIALLLALALGIAGGVLVHRYGMQIRYGISPSHCALRTTMRKLWSDHVFWTRCYLISALSGLPDTAATAERLLKNQADIGEALVPFYGEAAGKALTSLLRDHILIATDVVAAAKGNKAAALKSANEKWHANAREIAEFLSKANPQWDVTAMTAMMNEHLELTTQEAVAHLGQRWSEEHAVFDKVYEQALGMADHLTKGILHQFPHKF